MIVGELECVRYWREVWSVALAVVSWSVPKLFFD